MTRFVEIRRDDTWELVGVMDLRESNVLNKALLERRPVVRLCPMQKRVAPDPSYVAGSDELIEVVTLVLDELRLDRDKKVFQYLVMPGDLNNLHKCRGFRCPERWA